MRKNIKNIKNQRFGRLIVIVATKKRTPSGGIIWLCRCDCGNLAEVRSTNLLSGNTMSCGCLQKEMHIGYRHGDDRTRLYQIWGNVKTRCYNSNEQHYHRYGGRGITVCDEWKNDYVVFKKWALSNGYENNLTIDRINNDGNYEPNNCQWITRSENTKKYWREQRESLM